MQGKHSLSKEALRSGHPHHWLTTAKTEHRSGCPGKGLVLAGGAGGEGGEEKEWAWGGMIEPYQNEVPGAVLHGAEDAQDDCHDVQEVG